MLKQLKEIQSKDAPLSETKISTYWSPQVKELAEFLWKDTSSNDDLDKTYEFMKGGTKYIVKAFGNYGSWSVFIDNRKVIKCTADRYVEMDDFLFNLLMN